MIKTELCDMLGIKYPIIQAGMGPWATNSLAIATANAGALGIISTIGIGYGIVQTAAPKELRDTFGEGTAYEVLRRIIEYVRDGTRESKGIIGLNIPLAQEFGMVLDELFKAAVDAREEDSEIEERMRVIITSAGNPRPWADIIKRTGVKWFHVAPSVYHAKKAESAGADAVIASGHEGGGHVAFDPIHTMVLLPAVVKAVDKPVIGTGGFCDGRTFAAALSLGAVGIQMGTRFINTKESDFVQMWQDYILKSEMRDTVTGISVFGPARYLKNAYSLKVTEMMAEGYDAKYGDGVALEMDGISKSLEGKDQENSCLFGGEVAGRIDDIPTVKEFLERVTKDAEEVIRRLPGMID